MVGDANLKNNGSRAFPKLGRRRRRELRKAKDIV